MKEKSRVGRPALTACQDLPGRGTRWASEVLGSALFHSRSLRRPFVLYPFFYVLVISQ